MTGTPNADFWFKRRVAITGATGFVGRHLARELLTLGARVTAAVRRPQAIAELEATGIRAYLATLDDVKSLSTAFAHCDTLFHVAGAVRFDEDIESLRRTNVEGTFNVVGAAQAAGVRRTVVTSSIVAVGASRTPKKLDERASWNLGTLALPYAKTKKEAEDVAMFAAQHGADIVVVNPTAVIGPGDDPVSEFGLLCQRHWRGIVRFCFPGGMNFVDVRDVARGHLLAAERGRSGQRYILGGTNLTWSEFFRRAGAPSTRSRRCWQLPSSAARPIATVCEAVSKRRPALTRASASLFPLHVYADSTKAEWELGYAARPLSETIADAHADWGRRRAAA